MESLGLLALEDPGDCLVLAALLGTAWGELVGLGSAARLPAPPRLVLGRRVQEVLGVLVLREVHADAEARWVVQSFRQSVAPPRHAAALARALADVLAQPSQVAGDGLGDWRVDGLGQDALEVRLRDWNPVPLAGRWRLGRARVSRSKSE